MRDDAGSGDDAPKPPQAQIERSATEPSRDLLLVGGPSAAGTGAEVLRIREGRVETGELRALKEGQPVMGEVLKLSSRPEHERLFDVEVVASGQAPQTAAERSAAGERAAGKGPAKVTTDAYRSGWDAIFGKPRGEQLN